ncbi:MAG: ABC transporter ATP-binding protein [Dehalococcoidia bacterium]|nr:ABC transporter ATP-binding protein [Dehalococcoidia bacterium]
MPEPIIQVSNLVKTYHTGEVEVQALRGINIDVPAGEMLAIMGPSGCGKTTFLNCVSGIDDVTSGNVVIEGTDLASLNDDRKTEYRAKRMGFIFQFYNLLPVLSAVENVELPLLVSGTAPAEARRRASAMLERVGLGAWSGHKPAQLSGGQRQRVTIARALVNDPAIIWADEPTGDLDSHTADDIMSLMQQLNRDQGQTFVIVTHDPGIAERCHRIVHMRDGLIEREEVPAGAGAAASRG